jgi:hypothetical protein
MKSSGQKLGNLPKKFLVMDINSFILPKVDIKGVLGMGWLRKSNAIISPRDRVVYVTLP